MRVTYDPTDNTILVDGLGNGGWLLFMRADLAADRASEIADQVRYDPVVTGAPPINWQEHNMAFDLARDAFLDLSSVEVASHRPRPHCVTGGIAAYLAMRDRVLSWGGFSGEKEHLPRLYDQLEQAERLLVDARLRGERIVP